MSGFFVSAAPDPRRGSWPNGLGGEAGQFKVALEKGAQIIAAGVKPQFNGTLVDQAFHLRRAAERETHVGAAWGLLGGHLLHYLRPSTMKTKEKFKTSKLSMSISDWMLPLIKQRAEALDLTVSQYIRRLVNEDAKSS